MPEFVVTYNEVTDDEVVEVNLIDRKVETQTQENR